MTTETHTESVERGKQQIVDDVHAGRVPAEATTFGELHDYVDANEYGMIAAEGDDWMERADAIQCEIDEWLRLGGLAHL